MLQLTQVVALVLALAAGTALLLSAQAYRDSEEWVEHTHQVIEQIQRVRVSMLRGGLALRNYALVPQQVSLDRLRESALESQTATKRLQVLVADNPAQALLAQEVRSEALELTGWYLSSAVIAERDGHESLRSALVPRVSSDSVNRLRELLAQLDAKERELLEARRDARQQDWLNLKTWSIGLGCLFAIYFVWTFSYARRLIRLAQTDLDELTSQAETDPLTKLLNRRALDEAVSRLDNQALTVFAFDLDGFKPVNDTYGHSVGDEVLRRVAKRVKKECREGDIVARVGGDEFLIVMPRLMDEFTLKRIQQRLGSGIAQPMEVNKHLIRVTASIGYAASDGPRTFEDLLNAADDMSYEEKHRRKQAAQ